MRASHAPPRNGGRKKRTQIKPFNFLLRAHLAKLGHPVGADEAKFHLIALYETDPRKWPNIRWVDLHTGRIYRGWVMIEGEEEFAMYNHPSGSAQLQSYADVLEEYRFHPEPKSAAADGETCTRATKGLLQRRVISTAEIVYIGKEANKLEEVEQKLVHSLEEVQNIYSVLNDGKWEAVRQALPMFKAEEIAEAAKISVRAAKAPRNGRSRGSSAVRIALARFIEQRAGNL